MEPKAGAPLSEARPEHPKIDSVRGTQGGDYECTIEFR